MDKVENQCTTCDGLGWYVSQFCNVIACRECRMFEHDNEAFKFVVTTCEQWQRTIALIFATRLLAEAVPIEEIPEPQEFKDARREKGASLTLVCSKCGAAFGCCDHKGVDMVDPNTHPFTKGYVAPVQKGSFHSIASAEEAASISRDRSLSDYTTRELERIRSNLDNH